MFLNNQVILLLFDYQDLLIKIISNTSTLLNKEYKVKKINLTFKKNKPSILIFVLRKNLKFNLKLFQKLKIVLSKKTF